MMEQTEIRDVTTGLNTNKLTGHIARRKDNRWNKRLLD